MIENTNQPTTVHIGQKVYEVFEQRNMRLSEFAEQLSTVRQNVYRIFKKHHLDTGLLTKISEVLGHNFFQYYCQAGDQDSINDLKLKDLEQQLLLAKREIDYLKKIILLMEEKAELVLQMEQPRSVELAQTIHQQ